MVTRGQIAGIGVVDEDRHGEKSTVCGRIGLWGGVEEMRTKRGHVRPLPMKKRRPEEKDEQG